MTLLDNLDAFIDTLTHIKASSRRRYHRHAREIVRLYGDDPAWGDIDVAWLFACLPEEGSSVRSIVTRTLGLKER